MVLLPGASLGHVADATFLCSAVQVACNLSWETAVGMPPKKV